MKSIHKKVGIIGGGPVGMVAGLFLEKFGIDYVLFEKNT
jgi:2-polyprenyl-6-methoxyphenol hydroxylase-like FAD-dependent oxidoreductase